MTDFDKFLKDALARQSAQQSGGNVLGDAVGAIADRVFLPFTGRSTDRFPRRYEKIYQDNKDLTITEAYVVRRPIQKTINNILLRLAPSSKTGYDDFFHLSLVFKAGDKLFNTEKVGDGKLIFNYAKNIPLANPSKNIDVKQVDVLPNKTIGDMIEGSKKILGDKFNKYNAINNNCQTYVKSCVESISASNKDVIDFIEQDMKMIFKSSPALSFLGKLAKRITDLDGRIDTIIYGGGVIGDAVGAVVDRVNILTKGYELFQSKYMKTYEQAKDKKIAQITIFRRPIKASLQALNTLSGDTLFRALKEKGFDYFFHLAIYFKCDDKSVYVYHKIGSFDNRFEQVSSVPTKEEEINSETLIIPVYKDFTIGQFVENSRKYIGKDWNKYSGDSINCQDFIYRSLVANGFNSKSIKDFVLQNTISIFGNAKRSTLIGALMNAKTGFTGLRNVLLKGRGF